MKSGILHIKGLAIAAALLLPQVSAAVTINVDCDAGNSVNSAVRSAKPGDTLLVSGTCKEQVSIPPEVMNITLDGQKKTTIVHPGGNAASPHALYNRGKEIVI